jgi:hypothetical protein
MRGAAAGRAVRAHAPGQGRWHIYGLDLPEDVLRKVYRENALRLLPGLRG